MKVLMVKHIMIEDVVTAKVNITIIDAFKTLQEKHVGSIILIDDAEKCVGIFTERDAIRMVANEVPLDTIIDQVMTKNVSTIGEDASLDEAKRLIISHGIRHLPVVNSKGELVGLLSVRKLLDEFFGLTTSKYC
ncbi:CBS domain-containing protein [Candidatus Bathyarchaeota archaeon]|nr:CBS domain-containing protein [Candidatus Bathyarchaeota archaeon]